MGFFSFTCAQTGLPVMAGEACRLPDELGMCNVVAVYSNGERFEGIYDGYGRVDGERVYEDINEGSLKLVLKQFYNPATPFLSLGKCSHDPGQGYFHDWEFVRAAYGRTASALRHAGDPLFAFDSRQYLDRFEEHGELSTKLHTFMKDWTGMSGHVRETIVRAVDECMSNHEDDAQHWVALAGQTWEGAATRMPDWLRALPVMAGTALLARVEEMLCEAIRKEVISAWAASRPAREPNFERLLAMDLVSGWNERCTAPRERA